MFKNAQRPLADLLRPKDFDEVVGQKPLVGPAGSIRRMCQNRHFTNMIFYGPPGTGKTTVAGIVARHSGLTLHKLNATSASLSDVKEILQETSSVFGCGGILLYLDEIQYFNKKQQQSLLEYMEDGRITLIASTTENPYFSIYNAVISRSAVFSFTEVEESEIVSALRRAVAYIEAEDGGSLTLEEGVLEHIAHRSGGDVRRSLNLLENAYYSADGGVIDRACVDTFCPMGSMNFDRDGDVHYDLLSALQKSIRGSDPDAAIFYLARILSGGDLISACRRLQVIASEDVGLAYPMAPVIVKSCVDSAMNLGLPEARIPLSHAAILLATAPKSNSAYLAYAAAEADIQKGKGLVPPKALRQSAGFEGYCYPHDYKNHYIRQQYLPDDLKNQTYYAFGDNKVEQAAMEYWKKIKGE